MVICLRLPVFAPPNKYLSRLSLYKRGLVSCGRNIFLHPREGTTTAGYSAPGALLVLFCFFFLFFYPAVRTGSSNIVFFLVVTVPQTSAWSKQYLPVIFVRLAFIRQNFHESWCKKLLAI